jgi:hypothetical protein
MSHENLRSTVPRNDDLIPVCVLQSTSLYYASITTRMSKKGSLCLVA